MFRKVLADLLRNSLTTAKHQKNMEIDLLFRLAILKFLTSELQTQFANVILDGKEYIRKRGEYFERSQQAHVIKARLSEMQSARRDVLRLIGQTVAQILIDIEENVVAKARRALFGEDYAPYYEMLKNRLIFLDGGKDDFYFLEHYVLLGNYARDPDRFEAIDALFQEFLKEAGVEVPQESPATKEGENFRELLGQAEKGQAELAALEEQRESLRKKLERGDGLLNKFLNTGSPAGLRLSLSGVEKEIKGLQLMLEQLAPQVEAAKQQADFVNKDKQGKLGDYLNDPENARRLFDAAAGDRVRTCDARTPVGAVDDAAGREGTHRPHSGELRNPAGGQRFLPSGSLAAIEEGAGYERRSAPGGRIVETGTGQAAVHETD